MSRTAALLVVAGLLVGGAGPAAAGGPAVRATPEDRAILRAGVVAAVDVPAGWTATRPTGAGTALRGVPTCAALTAAQEAARRTSPAARSPEFSPPGVAHGVTAIDDTVVAFRSVAAASRFLGVFAAAGIPACLEHAFVRASTRRATVTVAQLDDLQGVGDASVGYEATITAAAAGQELPFVGDVVAVRVGRAVALVSYLNDGPVSLPEGAGVVSAVATRLRFVATG